MIHPRFISIVSICWLLAFPAIAAENESPERLTKAAQVRRLSAAEARLRHPVTLTGVVTFVDQLDYRLLVVQDDTSGICVFLAQKDPGIRQKQRIEVKGVTEPGGYAPVVRAEKLTLLGEGELPSSKPVTFDQLETGSEDSQWVHLTGIVRSMKNDRLGEGLSLDIATGGGRLTAVINVYDREPTELIDAEVRVQGIAIPIFNIHRQLYSSRLWMQNLSFIEVLKPRPAEPFQLPLTEIKDLLQFHPTAQPGHRVKVQGTVLFHDPEFLYIKDKQRALQITIMKGSEANPVQVGDEVEVVGFAKPGQYNPVLEDSIYRKIGHAGSKPVAHKVEPGRRLAEEYDSDLVTLEARLVDIMRRPYDHVLVLGADSLVFNAYLTEPFTRNSLSHLQKGSLVKVTGICRAEVDEISGVFRAVDSFHILLRGGHDVEMLASPSWLNLKRLVWILAIMGLVLVGSVIWLAQLKRVVRQQTQFIRKQLQHEASLKKRYHDLFENANDMVYTHDAEGRFTSINHAGEEITGFARAEILKKSFPDIVSPEQREAAAAWIEKIASGEIALANEWKIKTQGEQAITLEVSARPIFRGTQCVEVEGVARDVTERKRLEQEILDISGREQKKIGHDLHDGLCQHLAGIAFLTQILEERLADKSPEEQVEAQKISKLLHEAIQQTRGLARGLFPVQLEENGLGSALEELAESTSRLFHIHCDFHARQEVLIRNAAKAEHLYYITQEAVINAVKHGKAREVSITLGKQNGTTYLEVEDDGAGIIHSTGPGRGMGLRIMNYRARIVGGTLEVTPRGDKGTRVRCILPTEALEMSNAAH